MYERHGPNPGDLQDVYGTTVTLTNSFQEITVSMTDKYSGDSINVFAERGCASCAAGDAFYADQFVLTSN